MFLYGSCTILYLAVQSDCAIELTRFRLPGARPRPQSRFSGIINGPANDSACIGERSIMSHDNFIQLYAPLARKAGRVRN